MELPRCEYAPDSENLTFVKSTTQVISTCHREQLQVHLQTSSFPIIRVNWNLIKTETKRTCQVWLKSILIWREVRETRTLEPISNSNRRCTKAWDRWFRDIFKVIAYRTSLNGTKICRICRSIGNIMYFSFRSTEQADVPYICISADRITLQSGQELLNDKCREEENTNRTKKKKR